MIRLIYFASTEISSLQSLNRIIISIGIGGVVLRNTISYLVLCSRVCYSLWLKLNVCVCELFELMTHIYES